MELFKKIGNYIGSKNFLINLTLIILIYVVGFLIFRGCLDSSTNHGVKLEVPNLVGKNQNNLANILEGTNLKYEVLDSIYDPAKVEGTIIDQSPLPSKSSDVYVKQGRVIKVRVSKRSQLVEMPNLVDKSQRFAETILRNRKFKYRLEYKSSKEAHGAVMQQLYKNKSIEPGAKLPIGSSIKLIVGRDEGGIPQEMPNLYGLTIQEARDRVANMINMEFIVSCPPDVIYTKEDSLQARIVSQSPEYVEDARVISGSSIQVYATKDLEEDTPQ
ncbi:MAG: PASTA domain-containing protein [Crocinitomicaceae bacterium]|nr:PASTA domain-containing protein [Crocinitomicaceae bacterium]